MRGLTLLLCFLFSNLAPVLADRDAIGYELLAFYYAYKLQVNSNGPRTIGGTVCRTANFPCRWDEFLKDVMNDRFGEAYQSPAVDHTLTPDDEKGNLDELDRLIAARIPAQYKISALINTNKDGRSNAQVTDIILEAGEDSAKSSKNSDINDMKAMRDNARLTISDRYLHSRAVFESALQKWVSAGARTFIIRDDDGFPNWLKSLLNVGKAVGDGKLDYDTRQEYRNEIRSFGRNFRVESFPRQSTRAHLAMIQVLQFRASRMDKLVTKREGGAVTIGC